MNVLSDCRRGGNQNDVPRVQFCQLGTGQRVQYTQNMREVHLPHAELEFMEDIGDEHLVEIEVEGGEAQGERALDAVSA